MADTQLTSLTAIASTNITDLSSVELYAVNNGNSRRLSGDMFQSRFGTVPGILLVRSTNQPLETGVFSPALWDAADYDFGGYWDAQSPSIIYFDNSDVWYAQFALGVSWAADNTGVRNATFIKNGDFSSFLGRAESSGIVPTAAPYRDFVITPPVLISSGDTWEAIIRQTTASTLELQANALTFFSMWPLAFR